MKGKKGFQKGHEQFDNGTGKFTAGHKTNLGKKWKVKDTSNMKGTKRYKVKRKCSTEDTKKKISDKLKGKNTGNKGSNWQGGISILNKIIRERCEYHQWVYFCMKRDKYTCQKCLLVGGNLQVHHKKSFSSILKDNKIKTVEEAISCEGLWDVKNGETLCLACHKGTGTYLNHSGKKEV
jgi:hypothetical protein